MKRSRVYTLGVSIFLVVLVISGCAAPKAEPCPTTAPLSYPTTAPLTCPTTAVQKVPEMDAWRQSLSSMGNVVITFDKGDQCSMKVNSHLTDTQMNYEIVVNDTAYQNYMVVFMTLDPGKTLADLQAWTVADSPPYAHYVGLDVVNALSRTAHSLPTIEGGELYFSCFVQGPGSLKNVGSVGPLEVPAK
jgi:hypothetical protein